MIRRAFLPSFYDFYQLVIAIIGMIGMNRILFNLNWSIAVQYALATVAAYWIGQGIVSYLQLLKPRKTSLD